MASEKATVGTASREQATEAVATFLENLDHPFKQEVQALRGIILGADPCIREEIKWNAPSFYVGEHFATFNLHTKGGVQLVLHRGAKVRVEADERLPIADPGGLLVWRSKDRALAQFQDMGDVDAKRDALEAIVQAWIEHV